MKQYYSKETTIIDLCNDRDIGKYMPYLYYPNRYLNNVRNQTLIETAKYGLEGFNFLKSEIEKGNVKQYFVNKEKPDVSVIHISHKNNHTVALCFFTIV